MAADQQQGSEDGSERRNRPSASRSEWVVAGISALLVLGSVGFLLWQALTLADTPPQIVVSADSILQLEHGFLVEFRARNEGSSTAAGVLVRGELRSDTSTVQTSEATLDFVPSGAQRRGGLFFTHDPRLYALRLRAVGYDRP